MRVSRMLILGVCFRFRVLAGNGLYPQMPPTGNYSRFRPFRTNARSIAEHWAASDRTGFFLSTTRSLVRHIRNPYIRRMALYPLGDASAASFSVIPRRLFVPYSAVFVSQNLPPLKFTAVLRCVNFVFLPRRLQGVNPNYCFRMVIIFYLVTSVLSIIWQYSFNL